MNSAEDFKKIFEQLNTIEKIVLRTDSELRIVKKKINVMLKRISNIEKHLSVKAKVAGKKRANINDMTFTCSYDANLLTLREGLGNNGIEARCSFWIEKPAKPGFMRWGKVRERSPRTGTPYMFTVFIKNHFMYQHNHIVYLTSNRFYVYKDGKYTQKTPTKTALKTYASDLVNLFYMCIHHRAKQPQHVGFKLQDYAVEDVTDAAVSYVQNYMLQIKDRLRNSYNLVNKPNETKTPVKNV